MTFLPIVDRELRVAARKRSTFWLRVVAAVVTIAISGAFLGIGGLMEMQGGMFPLSLGAVLFGILTWMSFVCACFAGVFFSSDTLSEEKREGTLGLLFLTDLRGYDVVMGKLMAIALRTFYALLAVFPIVGVTLLMGGVTGAEFWQRMLALVNTLFFSLTAGMFVSSVSRESQKALGGTLLLVLVFVVGLPLLDVWIADLTNKPFVARFTYASPWYACSLAGSTPGKDFWRTLGLTHLLSWLFLTLSSFSTPRGFHEKSVRGSSSSTSWFHKLRFGTERGRLRRRTKLLEINPALWLAHRQRWRWLFLWVFAIVCVGIFGYVIWQTLDYHSGSSRRFLLETTGFFFGVVILALKLWMAAQASRFFVEARKNGVLELLLASPLPERKIINGQWMALVRLFALPTVLLLLALTAMNALLIWSLLNSLSPSPWVMNEIIGKLIGTVKAPLIAVCDLIALAWFGMWMGMTIRRPNIATLLTILFVLVIPGVIWGVLMIYLQMMVAFWAGSRGMSNWPMWLPGVITGALLILKDVLFFSFARRRLTTRFRLVAAGTLKPVWTPPPSPQQNLPPIIPLPQS